MHYKKGYWIAVFAFVFFAVKGIDASAQKTALPGSQAALQTASGYNIIPYPASLKPGTGSFMVGKKVFLEKPSDGRFDNEAAFFGSLFRAGMVTEKEGGKGGSGVAGGKAAGGLIVFKYDAAIKDTEAYRLSVTPAKIVLSAGSPAGIFMGIQTLRQLMPVGAGLSGGASASASAGIPCVEIADRPAFSWRGMMLDVSRHFFSVGYVKHYMDMMVLYKMNRLHLHLTDDQGWRVEIKKYPELTAQSAWRTFNNQDSNCMRLAQETGNPDFQIDPTKIVQKDGKTVYGGFYTQEDIREIVRYATAHHIDVIPEIDMPGHMKAATDMYGYLTCTGTASSGEGFSVPICPCNEDVMTFAKNVYGEIADMFPSRYVHIGGDEVEKSHWAQSQACKDFMAKNGIASLDKLQSYFTREMEKFFHSKGKTLIGWDEVIEGGVDSTAVVMWWRPWAKDGPLHAAQNHSQVIMTPDGPFYFDAFPDNNSLSDVYNYSIVPKQLTAEQAKYVIGGQANLWSETVPSEQRADYLVMPRMTALAENTWANNRGLYKSYLGRLIAQYPLLDAMGVNYRLPDLGSLPDHSVFVTSASFFVASPQKMFSIHYTTDGSYPSASSPVLSHPITISQTTTLKLALFSATGRRGDVYTMHYDKQAYAPAANVTGLKQGLQGTYYKGSYNKTADIKQEADSSFLAAGVGFNQDYGGRPFGLRFRGWLDVPQTGIYTFYFTCDDGGVLRIADRMVVDNDGVHPPREKSGQAALSKGLQPIAVDFLEGGGGYTLKLKYSIDGKEPMDIPASWFKAK